MVLVSNLVLKLLDQGISPDNLLQKGLIAGMDKDSKDFKGGTLFVPEVLIATRAMHAGM